MEHRSTGRIVRGSERNRPFVSRPTWGDLEYCLARMQGLQMLPLWGYDDALGWLLTLATFRRATWRAGESIKTQDIVAYFLEFKGIPPRDGYLALWGLAGKVGFPGPYGLIERLAGGRPDEN